MDPGDGNGIYAQTVFTPGGVNEDLVYWPWTNTIPTLATLGLSTTDTVRVTCEVEWSGAQAANMTTVELSVDSRTTAAPFVTNSLATDGRGGETVATRFPDSATQIFCTGPLKLDPGVVKVSVQLRFRFIAASASPVTVRVRRLCIDKL